MPLHVLQLGPYPPPEGGISRNMIAIRDELNARGHICSIIATSRSSSVDKETNVYHPRSAFELLRLLKVLDFDVLHLHIGGEINKRVLALAAACSLFSRNKSVFTLHSGAYPLSAEAQKASSNSLRGLIFRRYSRLIAVNEAIADVFRRYGILSDRIKVILPFSLRRPDALAEVPEELTKFIDQHTPSLVSVGGLQRDYDPLFQIDAMKEILAEFPRAGLMMIGDGSMRGEVAAAIAANGCDEKVYLAGNVDHGVTLHLINAADIVLRTTLFDGDAISIREALFLDTPVIATDTKARPEGVHLIEIGNKDELVNKVKQIVSTPKKERTDHVPDNENIREIVDMYEELV